MTTKWQNLLSLRTIEVFTPQQSELVMPVYRWRHYRGHSKWVLFYVFVPDLYCDFRIVIIMKYVMMLALQQTDIFESNKIPWHQILHSEQLDLWLLCNFLHSVTCSLFSVPEQGRNVSLQTYNLYFNHNGFFMKKVRFMVKYVKIQQHTCPL